MQIFWFIPVILKNIMKCKLDISQHTHRDKATLIRYNERQITDDVNRCRTSSLFLSSNLEDFNVSASTVSMILVFKDKRAACITGCSAYAGAGFLVSHRIFLDNVDLWNNKRPFTLHRKLLTARARSLQSRYYLERNATNNVNFVHAQVASPVLRERSCIIRYALHAILQLLASLSRTRLKYNF